MRTDWDDAPAHIRSKRRSPLKTILIIGIAAAIAWALALKYGNPIQIDLNQLKQAIRINGQPLFGSPSPAIPPPPVQSEPRQLTEEQIREAIRQAEMRRLEEVEKIERQRAQSGNRINDFNDGNYRPKQPVNIYTPPPSQTIAQQRPQQRRNEPAQERTLQTIKSWDGSTAYRAQWISVNNYIDSSSVCANYRRGSIEYRECRKGAKQHYHEECRRWRKQYELDGNDHSERMKLRYCSAANTFSPMG